MAKILNIETSTEVSSVCISEHGQIRSLKESTNSMAHAKEGTLLIEACLKEANLSFQQLDAVAVSKGPGSYTALRVGSSIAKGICYAMDIPLIAIDTLKSLAIAASTKLAADFYCPMIDARRKEVYMAFYNNEITELQEVQAKVLDKESFVQEISATEVLVFCGNGSGKFQEMTEQPNFLFLEVVCSAQHLIPLAEEAFQKKYFESLAYFEPTYLKPPNITIAKKKL